MTVALIRIATVLTAILTLANTCDRVAAAAEGKISLATRIIELPVAGEASALTFSPDGEYLAARIPSTSNVYVWAWKTGRMIRTDAVGGIAGHLNKAALKYSPDGASLALAYDIPNPDPIQAPQPWRSVIRIWDMKSPQRARVIDDHIGRTLPALEFSPDGALLLHLHEKSEKTSGDQFVVSRVADGQPLWGLRVLPFRPARLAVSPDGRQVALGGMEVEPGVVAMHSPIWIVDLAKRAIVRKINAFPADSTIDDLSWSPDGERLAAGAGVFNVYPGAKTVKVFSVATGAEVAGASAPDQLLSDLQYACAGKCLAEAGITGIVTLWDNSLRHVLQKIPASSGPIAVSRDKRFLALQSESTLSVWKLE